MNIIKKTILLGLISLSSIHAHIFEAEKWVNNQTNQSISLLGDYHYSQEAENQINNAQQDTIIDMAKTLNAAIIVEDGLLSSSQEFRHDPLSYDYNKYRKTTKQLSNKDTLLLGFTARCHEEGIKVKNVEFRFPTHLASTQIMMKKAEQMKEKIRSYNDGPILNEYYRNKLEDLHNKVEIPCADLFNILKKSDTTLERLPSLHYKKAYNQVWEYLWESNASLEKDVYEKIYEIVIGYESRLLDLELLHAIAEHKDQPIIICAGAGHITRIKEGLEKMGFACTHNMNAREEYDEPQALNMEKTLDAFYDENEIIATQTAIASQNLMYINLFALLLLAVIGSLVMINYTRPEYLQIIRALLRRETKQVTQKQ